MWKTKSSIKTEFLNKMILIVFVSIGLWGLIWIYDEYSTFKAESKSLRKNQIQVQKLLLKDEVSGIVQYIKRMKKKAEKNLEIELKERVYEAHGIAMNLYRQNADSKDLPEIKKMIKDALRPIRFNSGRGYYFAVSMDGVEQLYPVSPQFEGENLLGLLDSKGNFVIQDEIEVIKSKREGFVKNFWIKPGKNPSTAYPKISFIKYFKPLDWYFGAGEYLDDAKEQIQEDILSHIANLRFGTEGYFFGSTYQGDSLFSNGKITMGSGNVWDLTDPNGVKIIQEQRKAVKNPDGGFVYYSWHKLNTSIPSPKISFVHGISEWEWTIGAGLYLDTIERTILENKAALIIGLKKRITRSILILVVLLCLVYFWSNRISSHIAKALETFSLSLTKATTDSVFIDPGDIRLREFKDIAKITNKMLTSQKQAEDALKKNEKKYRLLIENQTDMIVKFDLKGQFQFVSPSYCTTFGKTRKELLNESFMTLIHTDDQDNVKKAIKNVYNPPYTAHVEERALTKDGWRWQAWLNTAVLDKNNKIDAIVAVGRDIDDQKKIELELIKSEQQFRNLFNSITDLVYTQDMKGRFTSVNPAMNKLFGYDIDEFLGYKASDFMELEFQSDFAARYLEVIKKQEYLEGVSCYLNKNKGKLYLEYKSSLVKQDGEEPYISGIARDVTERVLSKEKVKKLQEQIAHSQKMESIGILAGGIAHDFNNIMAIILGNTELALDDIPKWNSAHSSLEEIKTASLRAKIIVKQLLSFSRKTDQKLQPIQIGLVIKDALKFLRSTIPTTIDIVQDICIADETILADPTQINQIMMNLCINASHAMEQNGGKLIITVENVLLGDSSAKDYPDLKSGKYVKLMVSDTGPGIDPKIIDRIFDPYFTTKGIGKGSGMGLAVVHGIVKSHSGAIKVDSTLGKGTQFSIFFPLTQGKAAVEAETIQEIPRGSETILFVDDEISIVNMVQRMFERLGYKVQTATTPQDALEKFSLNPDNFDLVITDMTMPHMTGVKLAKKLMDIREDIPIIICTGHSTLVDEEKAKELGLAAYIMKPINMQETAQTIRKILDKK